MKLAELKRARRENPNKRLNRIFPDGDPIEMSARTRRQIADPKK
jgi:hypothetical protein